MNPSSLELTEGSTNLAHCYGFKVRVLSRAKTRWSPGRVSLPHDDQQFPCFEVPEQCCLRRPEQSVLPRPREPQTAAPDDLSTGYFFFPAAASALAMISFNFWAVIPRTRPDLSTPDEARGSFTLDWPVSTTTPSGSIEANLPVGFPSMSRSGAPTVASAAVAARADRLDHRSDLRPDPEHHYAVRCDGCGN